MTTPTLIYLGMGLLVARILLDGQQTRGYNWLQWLQFSVDVVRITLLWPLVLLAEKVETWLKTGAVETLVNEPQSVALVPDRQTAKPTSPLAQKMPAD